MHTGAILYPTRIWIFPDRDSAVEFDSDNSIEFSEFQVQEFRDYYGSYNESDYKFIDDPYFFTDGEPDGNAYIADFDAMMEEFDNTVYQDWYTRVEERDGTRIKPYIANTMRDLLNLAGFKWCGWSRSRQALVAASAKEVASALSSLHATLGR